MHWLPIETTTPRKTEVLAIAAWLGVTRREAFCCCVEFWIWAQEQSTDGRLAVNVDGCEDAANLPKGFCTAMVSVGWLVDHQDHLIIPHWDRLLAKGSKSRLHKNLRQRIWRNKQEGGPENVDALQSGPPENVDALSERKARPEKRREENINTARAPQWVQGENVDALTTAGSNGLEKTIVALWPNLLPTKGIPFIESLARQAAEIGATPDTLRAAKAKGDKEYTSSPGPEAVLRNFASLCPKPPQAPPRPAPQLTEEQINAQYDFDRQQKAEFARKNGYELAPAGTLHADQLLAEEKKKRKG